MTKTVGLTGGIGSGKTSVARLFEALGVPVYYADQEAKSLMQSHDPLRIQLKALFGEEAFVDGQLNRVYISKLVFSDHALLDKLNALVHPVVAQHYSFWLSQQKTAYIIKEVAILFESGLQDQFDYILTVTAPVQSRIERVKNRDKKSEEEILAIMSNQWKDDDKIRKSDFVIHNLDWEYTKEKVRNIHNKILKNINKN